jgi:HAD superfamily hydrolase (TIGR01450 family)
VGDRIERSLDGRMGAVPAVLRSCDQPLATYYDVALLDLDGVVYVGPDAVAGVPAALAEVRRAGMRLAYVTNNAARTPESVAEHLTSLGVAAEAGEVITSAQAAAHYLADRLPAGAPVLVVGTTGLFAALRERGLAPVESADEHPQAVVQGYSPDLNWHQLAEGAVAIRSGAKWIATNLDPTVPSPRGPLPGNGSMIAALRTATGVTPISTGKPDPTMHRESLERSGAQRPIVVGDRLDTDIEGATRVGCPSLLVLTGVTTPGDLLCAPPQLRPDYLGRDAGALLIPHAAPVRTEDGARCGAWQARLITGGDGYSLQLRRVDDDTGRSGPDDLDPLRALCVAAWVHTDAVGGGSEANDDAALPWHVDAADGAARNVTASLRLT